MGKIWFDYVSPKKNKNKQTLVKAHLKAGFGKMENNIFVLQV